MDKQNAALRCGCGNVHTREDDYCILEEAVKRFEEKFSGSTLNAKNVNVFVKEKRIELSSDFMDEIKVFLISELTSAIKATRESVVEEIREKLDTHTVSVSEYIDLRNQVTIIPANMAYECQFVLAERRRIDDLLTTIKEKNG